MPRKVHNENIIVIDKSGQSGRQNGRCKDETTWRSLKRLAKASRHVDMMAGAKKGLQTGHGAGYQDWAARRHDGGF